MSYQKIILSLGTIAVVAGVSAGATGAFFTSTAESQGNTFSSGSLNLQLNLDENNDGFSDSFGGGQTPGYNGLTPGGDEANLSATLENTGDADAEAVGLSVNHTNNPNGLAAQMRITQLDWKGESLLENAAGADLSNYQGPSESECDVLVDGDSGDNDGEYATVQGGVDNASSGDLVCVRNGTYTGSVDIATSDITLQSLNGPNSATIEDDLSTGEKEVVRVDDTSDVTIDGFTVRDSDTSTNPDSEAFAVLVVGDSDNFTLRNSKLTAIRDTARATGIGINAYRDDLTTETIENPVVTNNEITDIESTEFNPSVNSDSKSKGIALASDVQNAELSQNTIEDIGTPNTSQKTRGITIVEDPNNTGPTDFSIRANVIDGIEGGFAGAGTFEGAAGVFIGSYNSLGSAEFRFNNFNDGFVRNCCGGGEPVADAQYNWWGQMTGPESDQANSDMNTSNFLGGPHIGFVNGTDNNGNGFADLADLQADSITNASPGLSAGSTGELDFTVQLDGPTTGNNYQSSDLTSDFEFTLGQVAQ